MKHYIFATLAALLLILAGLVSSVSAQVYVASPDATAATILATTGPGGVTTAVVEAGTVQVECPSGCWAGETVDLSTAAVQYSAAYSSLVYTLPAAVSYSVAPVVSYSAVSEPYSAVVGVPEPYAVPVAVGGGYGPHGAFGHNSDGHDGGHHDPPHGHH